MGFYSSLYIPLWGMLSVPSYLYPKVFLKMTIIQVAVTELGPPSFWSQCSWRWIYPYTALPVSYGVCQVPLNSSFCELYGLCRQSHLPNMSLSRSQIREHNFIPISSFLCPSGEGTEEDSRLWDVCEAKHVRLFAWWVYMPAPEKQSLPRWEAHVAHVGQGERFWEIKHHSIMLRKMKYIAPMGKNCFG